MEPEGVTIHAKCEFLNPSGSIKDRLAQCIILDAEKRGLLQPDSIILECTSGNTGISLAMLGAALGHRVSILMSDSASGERRQLIQQLGAELILFKSGASYQTGIDLSLEMAANDRRYLLPRQFGLLVGTSSGANAAAVRVAQDLPPDACVVTLLCDRAERYFSTRLFADFTSPPQLAAI